MSHLALHGYIYRVHNLEYESTSMNNFMRSVKLTIVGAHCVDWSCTISDSDIMKIFCFQSNFGRKTFKISPVSLSCSSQSVESCCSENICDDISRVKVTADLVKGLYDTRSCDAQR